MRGALVVSVVLLMGACGGQDWPPGVRHVRNTSPVLSPEEALQTFFLPPGYRIELVAAEPLVEDPVAIDFDPQGRMWVVEMLSYMPDINGEGEEAPTGRIAVLEDVDDDGRMDRRTTYLDSLVLPRAVKVLSKGVLVASPPHLWLIVDEDGDLRADSRRLVRDDYGNPASNPEHNANGLLWALDNDIYSANYEGRFDGRSLEHGHSLFLGQWGLSMDDYGRIYRNDNSNPLFVDLLPDYYFARNANLFQRRGAYVRIADEGPVWPARPTPGVNRGYQEHVLRDDSTLAVFTAAGSPVVYRGDRLPDELRGNVFVTEPAGNLVRRFLIEEDDSGPLLATNAYEELNTEFLTSTDERFRPVNLASAPDGTLYVVDMYRGLIQHRDYVTGYLEQQVLRRGLAEPVGLGRIYRIVHQATRRGRRPALAGARPTELVAHLSHPNGWYRDTAQRLIVESGDSSIVDELEQLFGREVDDRFRLHALWTLHGLEAVDGDLLRSALNDSSTHVRAAGVRIAEENDRLRDHLPALMEDDAPGVRRQLAASVFRLPLEEREESYLSLLRRAGDDGVLVDLVIGGLEGREARFLGRLLEESRQEAYATCIRALAAAIMKSGLSSDMQGVLSAAGSLSRPTWQRRAMLSGISSYLPRPAADVELVRIERSPDSLLVAADSAEEDVRETVRLILSVLDWPGKPGAFATPDEPPLTPEEQERFTRGREVYADECSPCHGRDGRGGIGAAPPLVNARRVLGPEDPLIRIVLHGKDGEELMPAMRRLSDGEIASVLTYLRREWGHKAGPVTPKSVYEVRGATLGRRDPYTEDELR